jgi:hypothetical protein
MKISTPYNSLVPKTLKENLEFRAKILQAVLDDPSKIRIVKAICEADPLFFLNVFGWTFDPRGIRKKIPFILYPFQEDAILELLGAINDHDALVEKSRDMGASWICIAAMTWCWLFDNGFSGLFVSRVEEYVDKPGNPKAMFWKFDYLIDNIPSWLAPAGYSKSVYRAKMHVENPERGGVIDGESTTGNVARGDRRTAILLDEFAAVEQGSRVLSSTRDATNCRLFNSTPNGVNNAFFDIRQSSIVKIRLHWSVHPSKNAGLYTTDEDGLLKVLDSKGYPHGYKPILDGKLRSPWYDNECARAGSSQEIAQELDIDYLGSGFQYFNATSIHEVMRKNARPAMLEGELEYDDTTGDFIRFTESKGGHLRLWTLLDGKGEPPREHRYTEGADVSAGTGASNSCLEGYDVTTCAKVFEYVNAHIRPEQFAKQAVAIGRWFGNAYLIWESGGPGRQFGSRVVELGYGNIYMRKRDEAISGKVSDVPGVAQTKETKLMILGDYRAAVEKGECINYSKEAMEETLEYIFGVDGGVEHSRSCGKIDPSGAKANHGDRVMADALAWKALKDRMRTPVAEKPKIIPGCLAWRNQNRKQLADKLSKDGW